jgi:hypothetical protein
MKVATRANDGSPICPICDSPVPEAGQFCSPEHYNHFLVAVSDQAGMIEMEELVDIESQPWHTE